MTKPSPDNPFTREEGTVHLGGIDALVRLALDQVRTDRRRGLRTGMFISGYRGSPVGMLDQALLRQDKLLKAQDIHFVDGLNEDLAATAVWGTQMLHTVGTDFDGVTGMWYGKAPGVDRSGDALKHANYTGIGRNGGVLAIAGDDPGCKSSSLASQSEPMLWHVGMPSLYPANVQEILDLGLHGYQLSRLSGLWVGMKIVTGVADGHGSAEVSPDRLDFVTPELEIDGRPFTPRMNLGMNVRADALEMEQSLYLARHEIARRYARANRLNHVVLPNPDAWLGILTSGKTYVDVRQAFADMGLDDEALRRCGVRILKMGLLFPMEPTVVREFARGLEEIFVVEEKRPFLELFAKELLYGSANAPRIVGKTDEQGRALLPHFGELDIDVLGKALLARLSQKARVESAEEWLRRVDAIHSRATTPTAVRTAWFCSGCPHNSSTRAPEGSVVSAGIGCHTMAMWMDRNVVMGTHMGAEGAQWIGMAPFARKGHIFQNMGDGTYFHSGSLAIRYAAAAGVNITYKLLYNSHVSMTGGQEAMGRHPVADVVSELLALGVRKVIVTTDAPQAYQGVALAGGTEVWHRDRLDEAQRLLAATPGTTVLVHEQECAAELRRMRSRGQRPRPAREVVINERVCEGCGDCGVQSNCMSVEPVATEFGRKTRVNAASCNQDYSCLKGFCPSFVTVTPRAVEGGKRRPRLPTFERELPQPAFLFAGDFSVRIMGIGGTGTVTVASTIAAAARLAGLQAAGLDQTGLAQKGGPVISDVKVTTTPLDGSAKVGDGGADLYLGFDILNATDPKNLATCDPRRTVAVVSTTQSPTGRMVADRQVVFPAVPLLRSAITKVTRKEHAVFLDGQALAEGLFGDAIATNLFMVGVAWQAGALPIPHEAVEAAIRQAGVGVDLGLAAFRWGRLAVVDPDFVERQARGAEAGDADAIDRPVVQAIAAETGTSGELRRLLEVRVADLVDYQDDAYARRYARRVAQVAQAEERIGRSGLAAAVARGYHKLLAYKDEYEVARLHARPQFHAQLRARFPQGYRVSYHLAPPLLARRDERTGQLVKREFGAWMGLGFKLLARLKFLRGGPLDVFGYTAERRQERALVTQYEAMLDEVLAGLAPETFDLALALAALPDEVRGYGHVKERSVDAYERKRGELLARWRAPVAGAGAPAPEQDAASAETVA